MPRDGSGTYSAPSNTAAVADATIESAKFNTLVADLVQDANTARPVAVGGTGATSASAARTALGLVPGTDVQAYDADLAGIAALTFTRGGLTTKDGSGFKELAVGAAHTILGSDGTDLAWETLSAALDGAIGSTQGDVLYRGASLWSVLAPGTAGQFLKTGGGSANPSWATLSAIVSVKRQVFLASGTYTPSAGMVYADIEIVGPGGGGGGVSTSGQAGNGGGGGYSRKLVTAADVGVSKAATVGAVGTGGTAGDNDGGAGGASSIGSLCIANGGGLGRKGSVGTHGAGATAGTGDIALAGQPGSALLSGSSANCWGFGLIQATGTTNGTAGNSYGGGGTGASTSGTNNHSGGAGGASIIAITEYCTS